MKFTRHFTDFVLDKQNICASGNAGENFITLNRKILIMHNSLCVLRRDNKYIFSFAKLASQDHFVSFTYGWSSVLFYP